MLATDAGGWNDVPLTDDCELIVDAGVSVRPLIESVVELTDAFFVTGASGVSSETIFIPTEVPVLAGINSVVMPCFFITVLAGWYEEQHGEFVSPVEYESAWCGKSVIVLLSKQSL